MYHCNPTSSERYYLQTLLTVVRGLQSFEDLYKFNNVVYSSYYTACVACGLAEDDQEWFRCFDKARLFTTGSGLRTLFLIGLRLKLIASPLKIWNKYKNDLCDDLQ